MTADDVINQLEKLADENERVKYETSLNFNTDNKMLGVAMGKIFALAKDNSNLPNEEILKLIKSDIHEARMAGVSIMDFQARRKKTPETQREWLYETYLDLHEYINDWGLVDRSVQHVVGGYLYDFNKPRHVLYELAKSKTWFERRSAIVATLFFIRQGDVDDTFKIAKQLIGDDEDLVNKALGGVLREAGKRDQDRLIDFLNTNYKSMKTVTIRYATEKLSETEKKKYRTR